MRPEEVGGVRVIDVALTADVVTASTVATSTALVIDVLRASTTIVAALSGGCRAIVPVRDADEARRRAGLLRREDALLAGERRGEPIACLDLGNSPLDLAAPRVRGKTVVFTTSNGTRALIAARGAPAIGVAGLVNASAAARWAVAQGRNVTMVCAGERGAISLEDHVCAGLLVDLVAAAAPGASLTAAAREASTVARPYRGDVRRLREDSSWARHLVRSGRAADVDACLALDTATLVPVYQVAPADAGGVDEIVAGPR